MVSYIAVLTNNQNENNVLLGTGEVSLNAERINEWVSIQDNNEEVLGKVNITAQRVESNGLPPEPQEFTSTFELEGLEDLTNQLEGVSFDTLDLSALDGLSVEGLSFGGSFDFNLDPLQIPNESKEDELESQKSFAAEGTNLEGLNDLNKQGTQQGNEARLEDEEILKQVEPKEEKSIEMDKEERELEENSSTKTVPQTLEAIGKQSSKDNMQTPGVRHGNSGIQLQIDTAAIHQAKEEGGRSPLVGKKLESMAKISPRGNDQPVSLKEKREKKAKVGDTVQLRGNTKSLMQKFENVGESNREEKEKKRSNIVKEILATERNYVNSLRLVVEEFLNPLYAAEILNVDLIGTIFGPIESIYEYHKDFLKSLSGRVERWSAEQSIGDLFITKTDFLLTYSQYVNNFNLAMETLKTQLETPTHFTTFVKTVEQNPICNFQDLKSLLIEPIQRIPRYQLLIKDLAKNTDAEHSDCDNIKAALQKIETIANYINEQKRKSENKDSIRKMMESISSKTELKDIGEKEFVKEGDLKLVKTQPNTRAAPEEDLGYFFLLDDSLLHCTVKDSKGKYNLKKLLSLEEIQLATDITQMKRFVLFTFDVNKYHYEVLGKNQMDFRGWSLTLRNTVKTFKTTAPTSGPVENLAQLESVHDSIKEGILDNTISRAKKRERALAMQLFTQSPSLSPGHQLTST